LDPKPFSEHRWLIWTKTKVLALGSDGSHIRERKCEQDVERGRLSLSSPRALILSNFVISGRLEFCVEAFGNTSSTMKFTALLPMLGILSDPLPHLRPVSLARVCISYDSILDAEKGGNLLLEGPVIERWQLLYHTLVCRPRGFLIGQRSIDGCFHRPDRIATVMGIAVRARRQTLVAVS